MKWLLKVIGFSLINRMDISDSECELCRGCFIIGFIGFRTLDIFQNWSVFESLTHTSMHFILGRTSGTSRDVEWRSHHTHVFHLGMTCR